jgi:hypothetical protein
MAEELVICPLDSPEDLWVVRRPVERRIAFCKRAARGLGNVVQKLLGSGARATFRRGQRAFYKSYKSRPARPPNVRSLNSFPAMLRPDQRSPAAGEGRLARLYVEILDLAAAALAEWLCDLHSAT